MAKVLVIVPFPFDSHGLSLRRAQQDSCQLGPGIEFEYRAVKAGPGLFDVTTTT